MKIAVIGTGISGLTAAYLLNRDHQVTVYEKESRLGGHTATVDVQLDGENVAIDTGFIVFNDWTYPNFITLLDQLGVASQATSMGFSVSCEKSGLEYAGNNLSTLFAQKRNLVSPTFLTMVRDILRFNKHAVRDLDNKRINEHETLGEYLIKNRYSKPFLNDYLLPMGAAIWSTSCEKMLSFPVKFFVAFFKNHGLLNVKNRPTWRVISGGSKQYINPLVDTFRDNIRLSQNILGIERCDDTVNIHVKDEETQTFDQVVIATHSDQALNLLTDASHDEKIILGDIKYQKNDVVLHYDDSLLPKNRKTWSSWNYRLTGDSSILPTLTYNMNILQGIDSDKTFCVTLNDEARINKDKIIGRYTYAHPQFTLQAEQAKAQWSRINGVKNTWFCGAYWRNGFHEDGVVSAINVAEKFGIRL